MAGSSGMLNAPIGFPSPTEALSRVRGGQPGLVFCPPIKRREVIAGLVISFSMWQCVGHGEAVGPGFVD